MRYNMKSVYYIQVEDKEIDEGNNIGTLAGLKGKISNSLYTLVFTNHAKEIREKYSKTGVTTTIYENKQYSLTDYSDVVNTVVSLLSNKEDYLIVLDDSDWGNALGNRIAASLDVPILPHIEDLSGDSVITASRHVADTRAIRDSTLRTPAVVTVSFNGILADQKEADVTVEQLNLQDKKIGKYIADTNSDNDLAYAKVVVAGGKGLQEAENFKPLKELATKLNASVGATKAVTDLGWIEKNKMIGISNLTVKPDVYYAFGIAGAVQHTSGMDKSKHIIAVNTDRTAPIFKLAQYGIVGDANKVIDGLINLL